MVAICVGFVRIIAREGQKTRGFKPRWGVSWGGGVFLGAYTGLSRSRSRRFIFRHWGVYFQILERTALEIVK